MSAQHILVVEDRERLRRMMARALEQEGYQVSVAEGVADGIEAAEKLTLDLVLTDLKMPDGSGLEVVAAVRQHQSRTPVIVITGFGTVGDAVEAMKRGATDFLEKPLDIEQLYALVRTHLGGEIADFEAPGAPPIIGRHPALRAALRLVEKVAPTDSTVLISGESGTGKELVARAVHALSKRAEGAFVAVNCAALPEALVENELFGHEKGAYTGADRRTAGHFEKAAGGTLFLDEIGELPIAVQGKVLRVIEERVFERVGGSGPLAADVRLVAATNRDLAAMTEEGSFRSDLYFRLDVFPIELPPLRARQGDIALLSRHLLSRLAPRLGRPAPTLDGNALKLLEAEAWPGNVRQLANVLERAAIIASGPRLGAADLESVLSAAARRGKAPQAEARPAEAPSAGARADIDDPEAVAQALRETGGDKKAAAERLGVSYRTLQRRIRAFDLEGVPRYR